MNVTFLELDDRSVLTQPASMKLLSDNPMWIDCAVCHTDVVCRVTSLFHVKCIFHASYMSVQYCYVVYIGLAGYRTHLLVFDVHLYHVATS